MFPRHRPMYRPVVQEGYAPASALTPAVRGLIIASACGFIAQHLAGEWFERVFGLVPGLVLSHLRLWQLATYLFLHAGVMHLLFNMFVLWMFGPEVERTMGTGRFLLFYFFCGGGAGVCAYIFYPSGALVMGASGALFGVMTAFAMLFPHRVVTLLLFFVLPVRMTARQVVLLFAAIEILLLAANVRGDVVAHIAHLGGALFGYVYMRCVGEVRFRPPPWLGPERGGVKEGGEDPAALRERVDRILDKVSRGGVASLSEEDREVLRRAKDEL